MKRITLLILIISLFLLTSCKDTDVFGDYSLKYSYYSVISSENDSEIVSEIKESAENEASIELIEFTKSVNQGKDATLTLKGLPNTFYEINVHYASGLSKANSLVEKQSDSSGIVSWSWKIGYKTKPGVYLINILSDGKIVFTENIEIKER